MGSRGWKLRRPLAGFSRSVEGRWVVVSAWGELDIAVVPEMRVALDPATFPDGRTRLAVDLSEVTFCDSMCIGVLVGAYNKVRNRDGHMVLLHTPDLMVKQFKITGLDHVLTTQDAIHALGDFTPPREQTL
jgi:anti-sigma B factor antagonist